MSNYTKEEWINRFKNIMRPHVNDAPSKEELEEFLQAEAEAAYETVSDYEDGDPVSAAHATIDAIKAMG